LASGTYPIADQSVEFKIPALLIVSVLLVPVMPTKTPPGALLVTLEMIVTVLLSEKAAAAAEQKSRNKIRRMEMTKTPLA